MALIRMGVFDRSLLLWYIGDISENRIIPSRASHEYRFLERMIGHAAIRAFLTSRTARVDSIRMDGKSQGIEVLADGVFEITVHIIMDEVIKVLYIFGENNLCIAVLIVGVVLVIISSRPKLLNRRVSSGSGGSHIPVIWAYLMRYEEIGQN